MNYSKVIAFFQEFPFLRKFLEVNRVGSVKVQRIDRGLMIKTPQTRWYSSYVSSQSAYMLLDKDGTELATVGFVRRRWWDPRRECLEETIGDAIARLGNRADEIFFILYSNPMFQSGGFKTYEVTLYKLPKGFTIRGWLEEEIIRERVAIRAESEAIDVLADQK